MNQKCHCGHDENVHMIETKMDFFYHKGGTKYFCQKCLNDCWMRNEPNSS